MENSPIPDFRPNRPMDIMAFVMAQAEKRKQEETLQAQQNYRDEQKYKTFKETASAVSDFTQNVIDANAQKQLARTIAMSEQMASRLAPGETTPTRVKVGDTPEGKSLLETRFMRAFPKQYATEKAKSMFERATLGIASRPTAMPMVNKETGDEVSAFFDPIKKQYITKDINGTEEALDPTLWVKAYKADLRTDPGEEEFVRIGSTGKTQTVTGGKSFKTGEEATILSELSGVEKSEARKTKQDFQTDPAAKRLSEDLTEVQTLKELIAKRPKGAVGLTRTQLTVFAGEKGRLTDDDIQRNSGSPAIADRIIRTYNDLVHGNLSEVDAQDFKIIVELVEKKKAQELNLIVDDYVDGMGVKQIENKRKFLRNYVSAGTSKKIDRVLSKESKPKEKSGGSVPKVGETFNGAKVLSVEEVKE